MGVKDHLVKDAESTVRRSEDAGDRTFYLTFNPEPASEQIIGQSDTRVVPIRLPKGAKNVSLHGPGHFIKRGKGDTYGVKITFIEISEKGESKEHKRIIELPSPAMNVQLLDRKPDEAYKAVA